MVFIVQAAITIMESEIANRDNFSKQMYIQYYYYITYSNDDCCYDSSNYIKDLDLERERERECVCVCVCVCGTKT